MPANTRRTMSPRRSQEERRRLTSDRLMAAAVELFAEKGFSATTLAQIGARAGYSRETVRLRFGTKLALLEALYGRGYEQRLLAPLQDESRDGLQQALGVADELAALARTDETFLRVVYMVNFESLSSVPEFRPASARWVHEIEAAMADAFQRGIEDGSVRPDLNCREEASQWVATAIGLAFRWLQEPNRDHAADHAAYRERLRRSCGADHDRHGAEAETAT